MNRHALEIMRHAIGLYSDGSGVPYRNHFCTGPGSTDWDTCNQLVERELMSKRVPSSISGGDYMFHVTDAGRAVLEQHRPVMGPPVSRGRQRYLRWLHGASDAMPFGEWLKTYAKEVA